MNRDCRLKGQECFWEWGRGTVSAQGDVCAGVFVSLGFLEVAGTEGREEGILGWENRRAYMYCVHTHGSACACMPTSFVLRVGSGPWE